MDNILGEVLKLDLHNWVKFHVAIRFVYGKQYITSIILVYILENAIH